MKKRQNWTHIYFGVSVTVMFAAVISLLLMFMQANHDRIVKQNRQYLEDAATQTLKSIDEIFNNAEMSVSMVSRLYELQMTGPEFDYKLLDDMSEPTPFERMRFVSLDGICYSGDGETIDCTDREYYTDGIKGNSGITFLGASRFTGEPLFIFYTPLYYDGEIVGVVYGVINANQFSSQLDTTIFGYSSSACICTFDGRILSSSWKKSGSAEDIVPFSNKAISDKEMAKVKKAMESKQSISFDYKTDKSSGIAYIAPLENEEFMFVQTIPSIVSNTIISNANRDALRLEVAMIVLFIIYILITVFYYIRQNHRLAEEKDDLSQIINSLRHLYRCFVVFDLDNNTYEYLQEGEANQLGLPAKGAYSSLIEEFRKYNMENPEYFDNMDDMEKEHLQKSLTKKNWYTHRDYLTPDDRWERLSLLKLDMDKKVTSRILGAVEDITDVKRQDEERRRAMETAYYTAEAANRAKSDFLSRMSHDIRTPMNAIVGLTAIMGAHLDDRERIVDCLTKITSSSKHLLGLINEVLDMSKIESGKLTLSETEFSLPSLIDDLLDIVQPNINSKHQILTVNIHDITHEDVIGDNIRLQQVFVNIMSNAVKYTNEGGQIKLDIYERPSNQQLLGKYEFIFEDNGIGMSPEFLDHIFVPFERAEDERISTIQGTGLGMSIAQNITRLMGGDISVESEVGKGSKFTVRVSLKLQDTNEQADECLVGLPVLVADDSKIVCETTCLMLNDLGMNSEWVLSGREAVDKVVEHHNENNDFFAVILDWQMPEMDGVETARKIRKEVGPDVPIIILSAYDWSDIENEARAAGVNAFMAKPLFKSRLRGVFMNIVSEASIENVNPLNDLNSKSFKGKRALVVEDNELNQEIAKELLEMMDIEVDVAENGQVGVIKFEESPLNYYDIIFMDIQMPVMNGLESSRTIRSLKRDDAETVPIVAMTANTFSEDVQAALSAGMNQHIGKPLDIGQFTAILEKWL